MFDIDEALRALFVTGVVFGGTVVTSIWAVCKYVVPHVHIWWR